MKVYVVFWTTVVCLNTALCQSPDPEHLQALVMQQAQTIDQLQAKLASMETEMTNLKNKVETKVAFHARLQHHRNFAANSTIIFDHVDLNQGSGYDKNTGIFTAPVNGLYLFSLKIAHTPPGAIHVLLFKENLEIAETDASGEDNRPDRSSATVAVQLAEGQRVFARRFDPDSSVTDLQPFFRSSLTGVLIRAD